VRLVACDLDGTLLRPDLTVSERTRRALRRAQASGVVVALVTGRPPRALPTVAAEAGVGGLAICCNGALVYDLEGGAVVEHFPIPPGRARALIEALRASAPGVRFWLELETLPACEPGYLELSPAAGTQSPLLGDAGELAARGVTKLIARHPTLPLEELLSLVRTLGGDGVCVTQSGAPFVEVSAAGVDKARALRALCADLRIAREEVIAFGDMPNDGAMLLWAGRGVAVANAHPEALALADEVTLSNSEDGVALVLNGSCRPDPGATPLRVSYGGGEVET
jgi:HAD superfamily hydrolase (TIGR01484 family)